MIIKTKDNVFSNFEFIKQVAQGDLYTCKKVYKKDYTETVLCIVKNNKIVSWQS